MSISKVTAVITDNGSNFVKAFRVFSAAASPEPSAECDNLEVTFNNLELYMVIVNFVG